jgi:hypothetical protein
MVVQNADKAVQNANSYSHCDPGYCLKYVRTWLEIGSRDPDAATAWRNAHHKHAGDRHPPRGAPIFWTGGSSGHGHIALAKGDVMRSTDVPAMGVVGNDDGSHPHDVWGLTYVGWAEDLNGVDIPYLAGGGSSASPWAAGAVYVEKLHHKQQDSDSVARLSYRLIHHPKMPASHRPPHLVHNYSQEIVEAVRYWQRNIAQGGAGAAHPPRDGSSVSNPQANALFGDSYTVYEE